jgi:CubicO group peptidase (beta-lactamase class C family)
VNFSKHRLGRLHARMAEYVELGEIPGAVTLLCRRGELHVDAVGAVQRDAIFRITSMTKPITAAAAMILVEECRLRLDDPVDAWLPELAERRVLRRIDGALDDTVPAARPITLRDLLTFRLGLGLIFEPSSHWPIQQAVNELELPGFGPPAPSSPQDPDEFMRRLGTLPLMHQPGECWMYNVGSCVLGVLIARVAGQPFERFLCERLFEPLGMRDTGFHVPAQKLGRLASSDGPDADGWTRPPAFPDGSAGLVSSADDYLAFAQMLLEHGRHPDERILSRPSVELMTANQLTPEQAQGSGFEDGRGWGFGVSVVTKRDDVWATPGRYGWDGGYGTSWANDPREELCGILMTQRTGFPAASPVYRDFWTSAYQALDD